MFEAYVTNLGLYPERGAGAGEYLKFPTTVEEVQALFSRIGIDGKQYEEYFITDYDSDILGLTDHLGEYESLDELNYLAHLLEEMTPDELEKLEAVMDAGEYTSSVKDLINLTQNLDCFDFYSDVNSEEELGRMYIQDFEAMQVPEHLIDYIDYEAYGRDIRINDGGHFAPGGYVADNRSNFVEHYTGLDDIPDEYRISKVYARDEKEETHSILAAIKQFTVVTFAFGSAIAAIPGGIIYMLMRAKVPKAGSVLLSGVVIGLIEFLIGAGWAVAVGFIAGAVIAELLARIGHYKSFWLNTIGYSVYMMFFALGTYLPMVIMTGYVDDMSTSNGVSAEYLTELHSFMNGTMVVIIAVVTFVAGIIGALIAKGVFKKHFQKAGIV